MNMARSPEQALGDLIRVVARLRAPDGCPWDRAQTHRTLVPYLLEEAYEAAHAVHEGDPQQIKEHVLWVEVDEEGVHFLDAVFGAWDDLVNVRREYKPEGGRKLFKIFVAPGCLAEALEVLNRLQDTVSIGEIIVEHEAD